jgi:hypothetical protein
VRSLRRHAGSTGSSVTAVVRMWPGGRRRGDVPACRGDTHRRHQ